MKKRFGLGISAQGGVFTLLFTLSTVLAPQLLKADCVAPPSGLVAWYKGEGNADDSTGTNNGTVSGTITYAVGENGQGFVFTNASGYIPVAPSPSLDLGTSNGFTVEAWIKPNGPSSTGQPIVEWDSSSGDGLQLWVEVGYMLFANIKDTTGAGHAFYTTNDAIASNVLQHVAVTYDKVSGLGVLYLNGSAVVTTNLGIFTPQTSTPSYHLNIGRRTGQPIGNGSTFRGLLDELSFYGRALSQSEIQAIYNADGAGKCLVPNCTAAPSGLVGWWRGEGNVNDSIGTNNGVAASGINYTNGTAGQAFFMDSTNAWFYVPASSNLNVGNGDSFTVEAWINPSSVTGLHPIVEWNNGNVDLSSTVGVQLWIGQNPSSQGVLCASFLDPNGNNYVQVSSPSGTLVTNAWQHVAMTYSKSSGYITLYVNGSAVANYLWGNFTPLTSYDLWVEHRPQYGGGAFWSDGTYLAGSLDELSLYNRALTQPEIQAVYSAGSAGKCISSNSNNGVPVIFSFSPLSATNGTLVTIQGQNFNTFAQSNVVYFGAVRATVSSASTTTLTVIMPAGATYGPLTVTVNGLTAYSGKSFEPTFAGGGANITSASFSSPVTLTSGAAPIRVVIADLDGDGKPDLISANSIDHTLSIYRNVSSSGSLTTASFEARVDLPVVATADSPYKVVVADIDGDGKLDILALNRSVNTVSVFRNIATPGSLTTNSFAPKADFTVGAFPLGIAVRDLDGDGRPEIVTANYTAATVSVLRNTGSAGIIDSNSFAPAIDYPVGDGAANLVCGDLDGDGKPDIAVDNYNATFLSVLRNTASVGQINSNSFASRVDLPAIINCEGIAIGDLDGDGKLDLMTGSSTGGQMLSIYRNIATPGTLSTNSFQIEVDFAAGGRVHTTALGDLNGDGKPDIALTHEVSSGMSIFQNASTSGSFTASTLASRVDFSSGSNPWGISVGDLDGDGRPDVVFGNFYDNTLSIYRNVVGLVVAPAITQQPTNRAAFVGDSVTFNVTATGTAPLRYQWRFNGTNIVGATNNLLALANLQMTNAGLYSVVVTNNGGATTSSNAVLTVSIPTLADGMLLHYPFDGNALDTSGNGHNASIAGAVLTADRFGSNNFAYSFNGTSSYMVVPDSTKALTFDARSNRYTVSAWVKLADTTRWQDLLIDRGSLGNGHSAYRLVFHPTYGFIAFCWDGTYNIEVASQTYPKSNQWYNVAMVVNSRVVQLFVNGKQEAAPGEPGSVLTMPVGFGSTTNNETSRNIGRFAGTFYGNYLKGALDDIRIYGRALSSNDLQQLYVAPPAIITQPSSRTNTAGTTATFSAAAMGTQPLGYQWRFNGNTIVGATSATLILPNVQLTNAGNYSVVVTNGVGVTISSNAVLTVTVPDCTPPPTNIVSWWRAEGNAYDSSGTNNGTAVGGVAYAVGQVGQAFVLNGSSSYISLSPSPSLDIGNPGSGITIEGWIKPDATANGPIIEWDSTQNDGLQLWCQTGLQLFANVKDTSGSGHAFYASYGALSTNAYQHVGLTYDKTSGAAVLYINGSPVVTTNLGTITPQTGYPTFIPRIGRRSATYIGTYTYSGSIDDLAVYSRALSQSEIQSIYNAGNTGKCVPPMVAPLIASQPQDRTNNVGTAAEFTVLATGTAPLSYQWSYGGSPISGETNAVLRLENVTLADAGNYSVTVTNSAGSIISSNAMLTVVVPDCIAAPTNIASWWRAESNANDTIGTNNGVIQGNINYTAGQVGEAFVFDGSSYILVPASTSLNIGAGSGVTIEAWIKPNAASAPVVEWDSDSTDGVQLWCEEGFKLFANIKDTTGLGHAFYTDNGVLTTNGFQYVAVTYDKATGLAVLYRDGVALVSTNLGSFTPETTYPMNIGRRTGQPIGLNKTFNGLIDEVGIYSRALSQGEIQTNYDAGVAGKCVPVYPPTITTQPTNVFTIAGSNITFTVVAGGTDPLSYQWSFNSSAILGATNTSLTISNAQNINEGLYAVTVTNLYGSVTSSNAVLVVDVPPIADASATTPLLISVNNSNATVVLDGTLSSDADGDTLQYLWFDAQTNTIATGVVAVVTLPVATNAITLTVNDGFVSSSDTITVEVITISQALERLETVVNSDVSKKNALLAILNAALAAIDRSNPTAALNQLHAFQNQVQAQLAPLDPSLAQTLIDEAQSIIDAIIGGGGVHSHAALASSLQPNGKIHIKFAGMHQQIYIIEASTNLMDWEKIGLAKEQPDGSFDYDDAGAPQKAARFYRVTVP